jgi:ribosomal protein L20A (L18A)
MTSGRKRIRRRSTQIIEVRMIGQRIEIPDAALRKLK